jgi:hypothetical protein
MKAILDQDVIVSVSPTGPGIDIGALPAGVGLERLRWGGEVVVDLADLSAIYVDVRFGLHCVSVAGSQLVTMTYADRKNLVMDGGAIRVKTASELAIEEIRDSNGMLKTRLRSALTQEIGDIPDNIADVNKLIFIILESIVGGSADATSFLNELLLILRETYDYTDAKSTLLSNAPILQDELSTYYGAMQPEIP